MNTKMIEVFDDFITSDTQRILEVNSKFGEEIMELADAYPKVQWYPTGTSSHLKTLSGNIAEAAISNLQKPVRLEVGKDELPKLKFEIIFTHNTFHQMSWKECKSLMKMLAGRLREGTHVFITGPFKLNGAFKTPEHEALDRAVKEKDPLKGVRSFEDVNNVMTKNGFELELELETDNHELMLVYKRLRFVP